LLHQLPKLVNDGNAYRAIVIANQLGAELTAILRRDPQRSAEYRKLIDKHEKSVERGRARSRQVEAETAAFVEKVFPMANELASKNRKRGRLGIVEEVVKKTHAPKKRSARLVYAKIKDRLPPREK
jgi:hypothetical protein